MSTTKPSDESVPNGSAAAAILAAGIGSAAMGLFVLANDAIGSINKLFTFYSPTGGLSGVSTTAIVVWLIAWFVLRRRWGGRSVAMSNINIVAFVLLAVGVLLTFPPVLDFVQGR